MSWMCPNCGLIYENENEKHDCPLKPQSIDAYIRLRPESVQVLLIKIRETIRAALPDAEERISWRMPTYWQKHNIIHFAAFKKHIGLFPGDKAVAHFADRLSDYVTSKGAIQFPFTKPLPLDLISDIAKWCLETGNYHGAR